MSTEKNLYQRISAVMQDVKRLQKDKQVGSGSYAYKAMSEEKVATTLRTAMIEHGLVIFPVEQLHTLVDHHRTDRNGATITVSLSTVDVKYKLVNIDNPAEYEIIASSGTGVDPQDKGVGKAMTYSMKYALMRAFLIPTGEDPDNIHNEELARQQQRPDPAPAMHGEYEAALQELADGSSIMTVWTRYPDLQKHAPFKAALQKVKEDRGSIVQAAV